MSSPDSRKSQLIVWGAFGLCAVGFVIIVIANFKGCL